MSLRNKRIVEHRTQRIVVLHACHIMHVGLLRFGHIPYLSRHLSYPSKHLFYLPQQAPLLTTPAATSPTYLPQQPPLLLTLPRQPLLLPIPKATSPTPAATSPAPAVTSPTQAAAWAALCGWCRDVRRIFRRLFPLRFRRDYYLWLLWYTP